MENPSKRRKANGAGQSKKRKQSSQGANPRPLKKAKNRGDGPQRGVAAAYASQQVGKAAILQADGNSCRVRHREFIGNVTGSVNFTVASTFPVNPGMATTFPWLSTIAQNWESYRFNRLELCYRTRTGSNVPGSVLMALDPDASDAAPTTEQIMSSYQDMREDAPWKDIDLPLRVQALRDLGPRKFVRTAALVGNADIKLYDSGNLVIATVDGTAVSWGKLWIEYDVEFYTPQSPPAGPNVSGTITNVAGTGCASATPLGTVANQTISGALIASTTNAQVTLQALIVGQEYQCIYGGTFGTSMVPGATPFTVVSGLTLKTQMTTTTAVSPGVICSTFTATANTAVLGFSVTLTGAISNVFFSVAQLPVSAL